jgi:UPF0042 nucleotide-binding protein
MNDSAQHTGTLPLNAIILVVGLSGAGKSATLDALADEGFLTVENLPVPLLKNFIEFLSTSSKPSPLAALSLNLDSHLKAEQLLTILKALAPVTNRPSILYLDAKVETIIKRYGQTRRPHPGFSPARDKTVEEAVIRERDGLFPLRERADYLIDTSELNVHQLRSAIRDLAKQIAPHAKRPLRITFLSFGFKYGVPIDCDLLLDVRFLPNPFFVDSLTRMSGLDAEVISFVTRTGEAQEVVQNYTDFLCTLLPKFIASGRHYLNVGVGCTGGQHRSVVIAENLAQLLSSQFSSGEILVGAKHRDIVVSS